ncbi:ring-hydroxylating oxygenase subunit alpha [Hoeflea sp.]|uniref:ring-hydroxylating oxygenase subunit alpha n=1 Tax=Hoeflea sp. TaxID=1940281 RepID=UPI003BAE2B19
MARRPDIGFFEGDLDLQHSSTWDPARLPLEEAERINPLVYRSLTFSLLENEAIWTRDWIYIGTTDDIPDAGDLLPYTIGNHGIHVQRMPDGSLEGRFNNAQHGGCRVVPQQCQGGTKTKCSFTSCGYSRDRDAISASDSDTSTVLMHQYVGLRPERLLRISVAQSGKLIFVNLDGPDKDFAGRTNVPDNHDVRRLFDTRASKQWIEMQCNWKRVGEALFATAASAIDTGTADVLTAELEATDQTGKPVPVSLSWFYPNLIVLKTGHAACTIGIQPTSLGKVLCRIQSFGDASDTACAQDLETLSSLIAGTRDAAERAERDMVSAAQMNLVQPGAARGDAPVSPTQYWAQTVLIDRLMGMPTTIANDPMYQPLRHYLI